VSTAIPIPFGPWEPDKAAFQSGSLVDALNVAPVSGGYGPMLGFNPSSATLAAPILGASVLSDTAAATYVYAGSGDDIYVSNNGAAFSSVYHNGSALSTLFHWNFARFVGNVIAVHPQVAPVGGLIGTTMTALTGGAPTARVVGVVGNFLVMGDLIDGVDGTRRNRVRWSGFQNPNAWGTNVGTQADFNDMPDEGGTVMGIIGREFGTVFQRYSISRMTYVGPDTVFQFDTVEKKRGAISSGSIIDAGLIAAYIADDGFMIWDGTSSTPIGSQRVNEWFRSRLYSGGEEKIVGYFEPLTSTIGWAYPIDSSGILKERIIYSLTEDRWCRSDLQGAWFMSRFDVGYTLEQLNVFGNLETIPFSFDDPKLLGGRARAVGFDLNGAYGVLTGNSMAGTMLTGDWQSSPGVRSFVNAIRPQVDADVVTCAAGVRAQSLADPLAFTTDMAKVLDGRCPMRASGRYMRFRTTIGATQNWTRATGIEAYVAGEGRR